MKDGLELLNLNEINKLFDKLLLTKKEGDALKRGTVRDSLYPIVKQAKSNLQYSGSVVTGNLLKSIGIISKARENTVYAAAGARRGPGKGNHFHIINSGTVQRSTRSGYNRGSVGKSEFFDKAVLSSLSSIPIVMQESFNKRMQKFMDKKY